MLAASASIRSDNSLIAQVNVTLDQPARVSVEYWPRKAGRFRTRTTEASAADHQIPVYRLRPDTTYQYKIRVVDEQGGITEWEGGSFRTGKLPPLLDDLTIESTGTPSFPLALMDLRDPAGVSFVMVIFDNEANVVWYYDKAVTRISAIRQKPDYNLMFIEKRELKEITPLGVQVDQLSRSDKSGFIHHDFLIRPDNKIWYISKVVDTTEEEHENIPAGTEIVGDPIRQWDQVSGVSEELWNPFNEYSVDEAAQALMETIGLKNNDLHANTISIGPAGNVLTSYRYTNEVLSIAPGWGEIEWRLGGPNSDFTFPDETDKFYHQHTPYQRANGNIVMFDNGNTRPGGEYSRALELELDFTNMTAKKVWEYRHDPDIFTSLGSNIELLDNGNTLVNFGFTRSDKIPISIVEVSPDGEVLWELEISSPARPRRYRAYPMESISGEIRVGE